MPLLRRQVTRKLDRASGYDKAADFEDNLRRHNIKVAQIGTYPIKQLIWQVRRVGPHGGNRLLLIQFQVVNHVCSHSHVLECLFVLGAQMKRVPIQRQQLSFQLNVAAVVNRHTNHNKRGYPETAPDSSHHRQQTSMPRLF